MLGLDFGTASARALLADLDSGETVVHHVDYRKGTLTDPESASVARQDPDDYLRALDELLAWAGRTGRVVGIGVDATASTPVPVEADLSPLSRRFPEELDAHAWLWKDTSSQAEADEINEAFTRRDPERLRRVGSYNAEWYWAKALRCARRSPEVFAAADTWIEQCDFLTAHLVGRMTRGSCAAGHKALYDAGWPEPDILGELHPGLAELQRSLQPALPSSQPAGGLHEKWSNSGIPSDTPVAVGSVDAHCGAVGAGVEVGRVVMVLGTSACHMAVTSQEAPVAGISGIARDSILPGFVGIEAGQAAFGDLLEWAARAAGSTIEEMSDCAARVPPGSNGLLALDFHNGNRCPYADADLGGVVMGLTLRTTPAEAFRANAEALAFGVRQVFGLLDEGGAAIREAVACGGVAENNEPMLQLIADTTGMPIRTSLQRDTCALGAAIFGAVASGQVATVPEAQARLCRLSDEVIKPDAARRAAYDRLFPLWLDAQRLMAKDSSLLKRLRRGSASLDTGASPTR